MGDVKITRNDHLLVKMMEECSEITKEAAKSFRFGIEDINPTTMQKNRDTIIDELKDLLFICSELGFEYHLSVSEYSARKDKFELWLNHSKQNGRL